MHASLSILIVGLFTLVGCDSKEVDNSATIAPKTTIQNTQEAKETSSPKAIEENATNVATSVQETANKVSNEVAKTTTELEEQLKKSAEETQVRLEKTMQETQAVLPKADISTQKSAPAKAKACASCHGNEGEKVALGKSKIMNQLTKQEIIDALKGYQNGTYGGSMKAVMLGQVKNLTPEEIEELAQFYSAK